MRCAVLQPSYLPWRGYFHQIQKADVFVFYDDVQYDKHGWRNRNRIKTANGPQWLTVPVSARGNVVDGLPINEVQIADGKWPGKHLATIRQAYAQGPALRPLPGAGRAAPGGRPRAPGRPDHRADRWRWRASSASRPSSCGRRSWASRATGWTACSACSSRSGATHYISGPAARDYMDEARLTEAGISLEYMEYDYPEYRQLHPPYEPQVSVIDLIAMEGDAAPSTDLGRLGRPAGHRHQRAACR